MFLWLYRLLSQNYAEQPLVSGKVHDTEIDEEHNPNEDVELRRSSGASEDGDKLLMRERTYSAPNVTYSQTARQRREVSHQILTRFSTSHHCLL